MADGTGLSPGELTELLQSWRDGDRAALDRVLPVVCGELRSLAARHLATERPGHTLQATALVHEAYLRLVGQRHPDVELRYFSGMTVDEIAEVMGISTGTVKRDWTVARAWLFAELQMTEGSPPTST